MPLFLLHIWRITLLDRIFLGDSFYLSISWVSHSTLFWFKVGFIPLFVFIDISMEIIHSYKYVYGKDRAFFLFYFFKYYLFLNFWMYFIHFFIQQVLIGYLFYTYKCIYVNPRLAIHPTTTLTPPLPLSPLGVYMFVHYFCVSISALQTGSSVPFF